MMSKDSRIIETTRELTEAETMRILNNDEVLKLNDLAQPLKPFKFTVSAIVDVQITGDKEYKKYYIINKIGTIYTTSSEIFMEQLKSFQYDGDQVFQASKIESKKNPGKFYLGCSLVEV